MANSSGGPGMTARGATLAWAVLVLATLAGWWMARTGGATSRTAVILIGGAKIYLVIAVFMGLWRAPRGWHAAALVWVLATCALVLALAGGAAA